MWPVLGRFLLRRSQWLYSPVGHFRPRMSVDDLAEAICAICAIFAILAILTIFAILVDWSGR